MLVKNGQADELAARALIKVQLIGSDCRIDKIYGLLLQILCKRHFCDNSELKVGLVCSFFEVFNPYLHEEGVLERRFFEVHP